MSLPFAAEAICSPFMKTSETVCEQLESRCDRLLALFTDVTRLLVRRDLLHSKGLYFRSFSYVKSFYDIDYAPKDRSNQCPSHLH
jgi:hypothetical protein